MNCVLRWTFVLGLAGVLGRAGEIVDPVRYVDPFIGVDDGGNVLPGPSLPFSMVRLGPDVPKPPASGYSSGKPVVGFSHNHVSGTGGKGRFLNVRITPQTGPLEIADIASPVTDERAEAGYYAASLSRWNVRAELTSTPRSGVHRYTFAAGARPRILLDPSSTWVFDPSIGRMTYCVAAQAKAVSDRAIEGSGTFAGGWGNDAVHTVYFVAEFDRPFATCGAWRNQTAAAGARQADGMSCGMYFEFEPTADRTVGLRVGISYVSLVNARRNLGESSGRSFEDVKSAAQETWREFLQKIRIEGGTEEQRRLFYTSLYRSVVMPTDVTGENPRWQSDEPHYWDFYTFWDTFHCVNSLYALIIPEREESILRCLVDIYRHRGYLPDAWIQGEFAQIQGGTNADIVIADGVVKGLRNFDVASAYEAIRKDATVPGPNPEAYGRAAEYFQFGYIPCESLTTINRVSVPSSRTLEYAMDDFAVAQVARALGRTDDADRFTRQSLNAFNLFNPETKFFWAKDAGGRWLDGFSPTFETRSWVGPFYEGTPWQYAAYVPHDMQGLINRHGGDAGFGAFLDQMFDGKFYTQANEPDLLAPWLYTYINQPARNADRVRAILADSYHGTRNGLPGNDDAGTMSSWYVFGALGFFPNAGQDVYLIGSPLFPRAELQLGNGKRLTLVARGVSEQNRYVQSATLNGKPWTKGWFRHGDIAGGGEFVFVMGPSPSDWGTHAERPPSISRPLQ